MFETPQADPSNVASIILGGGAGTRLFPLTSRRAKPAVRSDSLIVSGNNLSFCEKAEMIVGAPLLLLLLLLSY